jgi:DNA-binding NarL/FixJ family response regulator
MMRKISIVLAEDHALMREGTRRILEENPDLEVVGEANDGEQALDLLYSLQPDIVILDIRLPKLNGIEVVSRMHDCSPNTKALMLTAYDDDEYVTALMQAGAQGYLLKTAHPKEVAEAVRSIHSGETVLHPVIAAKVARFWAQSRISSEKRPSQKLSTREMEVLELAAKGLKNKEIANGLSISVRTVEGHFNSIFAKLGVASRMEAVLYALSNNLVSLVETDKK